MGRWARPNYAALALVVAVLSLLVTAVQSYSTQSLLELAKEQLADAKDQFVRAGPLIAVSSTLLVGLRNTQPGQPAPTVYADSSAPPVTPELEQNPTVVALSVQVINTGRSSTILQSVALKLAASKSVDAQFAQQNAYVIYCRPIGNETFSNCAQLFPMKLEPGEGVWWAFSLPQLRQALAGAGADNGLDISVEAAGVPGSPVRYHSAVTVRP